MFFRNLTFFRFPVTFDIGDLQSSLNAVAMKPVGALELASRGFIPPFGHGSEAFFHQVGHAIWLTVGVEDRLLPARVLNGQLAKKIAAVEELEGRKLGARARNRLKYDLIHEMLPKAFVNSSRIDALLNMEYSFIAIDTTSTKGSEAIVSEIRRALGSFPALPLNVETGPRNVLTGWVAGETMPEGLTLGEECELRDPVDSGAIVKCQFQNLGGKEIAQHLKAGKQVTRLALTLGDRLSFVLGEDLIVRKLKLLDGAVDQLDSTEREDLYAELNARFTLFSGEVKALFALLEKVFKITKVVLLGQGGGNHHGSQ